jgi:glycosyltransferase involved in cell wall biosynthesis
MKVSISVAGQFHAFYLAQQLLKRGFLERLITSYPKFKTRKFGISNNKVKTVLIKEIILRGWGIMPGFIRRTYDPSFLAAQVFDWFASLKIPDSDIFVGWSSKALRSLRIARKRGMITVLERGSSHIAYNEKILREEYEKWGEKGSAIHPKIIEKELREYEEADYISIPSLFVKRTFLEAGVPESKLIHIPYGVDLEDFKQKEKRDSVFRVVCAGGMTLQKGVHYLLQAFSELNLPGSELLLIGGISDEIRPFFKKYEGKFKYVPAVPQSELADYYSQSSVFVLNSVQDGFGMVIIQAMACGLPVIATENTGGPDVVENGKQGFIIPIRSVEALKEKISYLYENQGLCLEMGRSAKEKVSSGFTWNDYGDKMVKAYEKILSAKTK